MSELPHAEVVVDTERGASRAGIRASGAMPRQILFRCGAHELDVMLPSTHRVFGASFLWGQLLGVSAAPYAGALVAWLDRLGASAAESSTDEFGEFRLAAPRCPDGALRVTTGDAGFLCRIESDGCVNDGANVVGANAGVTDAGRSA